MYYYLLNSIGLRSRLLPNELNIYLTFSSSQLTVENLVMGVRAMGGVQLSKFLMDAGTDLQGFI